MGERYYENSILCHKIVILIMVLKKRDICKIINILKVTTTSECPTLSCSDLALLTLPHSPGWFWVGTFLFRTCLYSLRLPTGIMLIASLLNLPDKKGLTSSCFRIGNPFISKRISPVINTNTLNLDEQYHFWCNY